MNMVEGSLDTTNLLLGILAAVSVLEALVLVGIGVMVWRLYTHARRTIHEIEQRQIAPSPRVPNGSSASCAASAWRATASLRAEPTTAGLQGPARSGGRGAPRRSRWRIVTIETNAEVLALGSSWASSWARCLAWDSACCWRRSPGPNCAARLANRRGTCAAGPSISLAGPASGPRAVGTVLA